jgi:uncharacterized membrane protein
VPTQTVLLIAAATIAILSLPLIFKWVPPNRLYGFRTPRTKADPDLWYRANSFGGWALLVAAAFSAILLFAAPSSSYGLVELVAPIGVAVVASFVYSSRAD